jgi:acyl carrier protein
MEALKSSGVSVWEILHQSLEGSDYDLEVLERQLQSGADFEEAGLDSLELTEFFLRLQDHFKIAIRREEYPGLTSIGRVEDFLKTKVAC